MSKINFDPNATSIINGNYFGFPFLSEEAELILISIPWDVTTSYGEGTAKGPRAILDASLQLDFYLFGINKPWEIGIGTLPVMDNIAEKNAKNRKFAKQIIDNLEQGTNLDSKDLSDKLSAVNKECAALNLWLYKESNKWLNQHKIVGIVGGEHSVPLGLINALSEKEKNFGILQIDAHADLRKAYQGFDYSHASIMYNALKNNNISKLVQVGIRDICPEEIDYIKNDNRIVLYNDFSLHETLYGERSWLSICDEILLHLPDKVYISFDIDGLSPENCPNTGTPVPGGLSFNQAVTLIKSIAKEKQIIGFDLCEVSPSLVNPHTNFDGNVGARLLYLLSSFAYGSHHREILQ
ncbi:MAG: agmatinase family protein [Ignavibacteria bacterium]|jgi:agmatinase